MQIVDLDAGSYLQQTSAKDLATVYKENKDNYLQPCLEPRRSFTQMLYSAYGIPGTESVVPQQRLASLLSINLKREYLEMCGFVRARMSLEMVISNSLLLQGAVYKEV